VLRDRTSLDLTVLIVGLLLWPGLAIGQSSDELQGVERELQQGADKAEELNRKVEDWIEGEMQRIGTLSAPA